MPLPHSLFLMPFPHTGGLLTQGHPNPEPQLLPALSPARVQVAGRAQVGMKGRCEEPARTQPQLSLANACWVVHTFIIYSFSASRF